MNNFQCLNHLDDNCKHKKCNLCSEKGQVVTDDSIEAVICPNSNEPLKLMGQIGHGFSGTKMTKEQVKKDRTSRSTKHFRSEILPYLPPADKKDFAKKGKKPL